MYDVHTHSFESDGILSLAELARRCQSAGYQGLAITDHCDHANIERLVSAARVFCQAVRGYYGNTVVLPGCEITHVPPPLIEGLVGKARELGAQVVIVHGETIVEPVQAGTNRAAIQAGADVLAHPGLISPEDAALAAEKGVLLEISGRKGHCFTNGHVVRLAQKQGAGLAFGSDGHEPGDYPDRHRAESILRGAGLSAKEAEQTLRHNAGFFQKP